MSTRNSALLWNLVFSFCLATAVFWQLAWLRYALIGFVWFMCLIYLYVFLRHGNDPDLKGKNPSLSPAVGWTFSILNAGLMVADGWYVTLVVYAASCICASQIYSRLEQPTSDKG